MLDYFLLGFSVFSGSFKSIVNKKVKQGAGDMKKVMLVNALSFFVAFLVILCFTISSSTGLNAPFLFSLGNALWILLSQIFLMKAVETGPVSLSSLFYSCGFILPTVYGAIAYQESVHWLQILGIFVVLVSFSLSVDNSDQKKFNFTWFFYAIASAVCSGLIGIFQKIFVVEYGKTYSLDSFLALSFLLIIVISFLFYVYLSFRENRQKESDSNGKREKLPLKLERLDKITLLFTLLLGLILAFHNKICTYLSGALPSVLYFPVMNGGVISVTALLSGLIFQEKLTKKQWVSIATCFLAIGLIALGKYLGA